eukprot:scaffold236_cov419-Prasinococcus_capsulatus_cf.AAC.40
MAGIDGLRGTESCYFNVSDPSQGSETVANGKANYVCKSGPSQVCKCVKGGLSSQIVRARGGDADIPTYLRHRHSRCGVETSLVLA